MSTASARTGSAYGYSQEILPAASWNNLVKSIDMGVLRILAGMLLQQGVATNTTAQLIVDEATNRIEIPTEDAVGVINGVFFYMDDSMEIDTTATSGSTTTAANSALTYVDNFWKDAYIIFTSGTNNGLVRKIDSYDGTLGKFTWTTPTTAAVASSDTFIVSFYYVSGLTVSTVNYVYAQLLSRTPYDSVITFVANITGTAPANSILLSTVTLDGDGVATASNNAPTGAQRKLYAGIGGFESLTYTALVEDVPATSYTDVEVTHAYFLYRGGLTVTVDAGTVTVLEHYKNDHTKIRISNSTGSPINVNYTLNVNGLVRTYI